MNETNRLYGVMDRRLAVRPFLAGDEYSIADMASYPWVVPWKRQQQNLDDFVNLRRWFNSIRDRPATQPPMPRVSRSRPNQPLRRKGRNCCSARRRKPLSKPDSTVAPGDHIAVFIDDEPVTQCSVA